jgi:hypothetical protein
MGGCAKFIKTDLELHSKPEYICCSSQKINKKGNPCTEHSQTHDLRQSLKMLQRCQVFACLSLSPAFDE